MHNECNVPTDEKCCTRLFSICACHPMSVALESQLFHITAVCLNGKWRNDNISHSSFQYCSLQLSFGFFCIHLRFFFPVFVSVKGHSFPERKKKIVSSASVDVRHCLVMVWCFRSVLINCVLVRFIKHCSYYVSASSTHFPRILCSNLIQETKNCVLNSKCPARWLTGSTSTSGSGSASGVTLERGCGMIDFDFGFDMDPV